MTIDFSYAKIDKIYYFGGRWIGLAPAWAFVNIFFHVDKFGRIFISFARIDGNLPPETNLTLHDHHQNLYRIH